ncbi:MAG: VanZ family protein [Pirellulaceae bacterium]|nr:VanZ family protein [Pirellulaceae bacterium]
MTKRTRSIVRLVCLAYAAFLSLLLLVPDPARLFGLWFPRGGGGGIGIHFSTFLTLGVLVGASRIPIRTSVLVVLLLFYAIGIEFLQLLSPPRTVEFKDLVENLLGLVIGVTLWRLAAHQTIGTGNAVDNAPADEPPSDPADGEEQ